LRDVLGSEAEQEHIKADVVLDGFVGFRGEVVERGVKGWDVAGQVLVGQVDQVNETV
jgi:hypothetical protein